MSELDGRARARILVVDDEPIIIKTSRYILGRKFEVVTASSVAEELARVAAEGPFDAALVDDRMPDGRGPVVLQALQERWPGCLLFLVSANLGITDELDATFFAAVSFRPKPLDLVAFVGELEGSLAARLGPPEASGPKEES